MILWDIMSGKQLKSFEGHDRGLACVEFKGDLIVSGSSDRKIKIWNANTGSCLKTLEGHNALVRALAFDPQNGRLVSASYSGSIRVWDVYTGETVREFKDVHESHIFDVKFDDSKIVRFVFSVLFLIL
jgi:F-box and WD-40 domain protein 1/11